MQINEIFDEMKIDLEIGKDIANDSVKTPYTKAKWLQRLFNEQMYHKKISDELADLMPVKFEYYSYKIDNKPTRRDVFDVYIPSDKEIQTITRKIEMSIKKIELMEQIIKSLDQRTFQIKNYIDWKTLIGGGKHG